MKHFDRYRISILRTHFSKLSWSELCRELIARARDGKSGYVCVSNVHTTMMGFWDSTYREIQNNSAYTVPDGVPIVWAMNILRPRGSVAQDRVRGPSLMRELCSQAPEHGLRHYLFGGTPEALRDLEATLRKEYPNVVIAGSESPPFLPWTDADVAAAVKRINDSGANIVWVGLGAPKQERWMHAAMAYSPPLMLGVGAAFDLLPGRIPEAPEWMRSSGLEWLFRLLKEPRRLWRRYLFHNPAFIFFFLCQWLSSLLFRRKYLCESGARE